jgi:hypothetical protein
MVARAATPGQGIPGAEDRDFVALRLRHDLASQHCKDDPEGK